jgi:hypothetical protein
MQLKDEDESVVTTINYNVYQYAYGICLEHCKVKQELRNSPSGQEKIADAIHS